MSWGMVAVAGASLVGAGLNYDANKKAQKAQQQASSDAIGSIEGGVRDARSDIYGLFPQAQQAGQQGFQGAMDMFNQSINPQMQAFQGGNVAAQNQILAGLPQIQNALLGNQVDLSQLQAYQAPQQDLSFMNQQLNYQPLQMPTPPPQIMGPQQAQQQPGQINMASGKGWLAGNKKVLESDPANRLAKKLFGGLF
jgi:hypothetical protein